MLCKSLVGFLIIAAVSIARSQEEKAGGEKLPNIVQKDLQKCLPAIFNEYFSFPEELEFDAKKKTVTWKIQAKQDINNVRFNAIEGIQLKNVIKLLDKDGVQLNPLLSSYLNLSLKFDPVPINLKERAFTRCTLALDKKVDLARVKRVIIEGR